MHVLIPHVHGVNSREFEHNTLWSKHVPYTEEPTPMGLVWLGLIDKDLKAGVDSTNYCFYFSDYLSKLLLQVLNM